MTNPKGVWYTLNMKNVINTLRIKLTRKNARMNGLEVLEAYRALHPVTDEPLNITFVDMYKALVQIATGAPAVGVQMSVR